MLYLQDLVVEKLHKESHLRNLVAHMALGKRLQEMLMEYNVEDCVPAGKTSQSFAESYSPNQPGPNTSNATTPMSNLCEEYGTMTLDDR
jgi:hypothetical protein